VANSGLPVAEVEVAPELVDAVEVVASVTHVVVVAVPAVVAAVLVSSIILCDARTTQNLVERTIFATCIRS
jgi:hypothetical protein